ncbi:uncharacterized protein G2W53_038102 [Senna tora]|uniref:Uncharacterized protein n=1 Tax=Senna tora TaxID=362788 RepID=A0A834W4W5_9FABA|nr:uncharacterized protein G2W53_038102 [Senna tora]
MGNNNLRFRQSLSNLMTETVKQQ